MVGGDDRKRSIDQILDEIDRFGSADVLVSVCVVDRALNIKTSARPCGRLVYQSHVVVVTMKMLQAAAHGARAGGRKSVSTIGFRANSGRAGDSIVRETEGPADILYFWSPI